jgi:hypothetical protein
MDTNRLSQIVAETLSRIAAGAGDMKPLEIVKAYEQAESELLPTLSASPELQQELRRRIAEWKFTLLSGRELSFHELSDLHAKVVQAGFSNIQKEITAGIVFARICRRYGEIKKFQSVLHSLESRLNDEAQAGENEILRDLRKSVLRLSREE